MIMHTCEPKPRYKGIFSEEEQISTKRTTSEIYMLEIYYLDEKQFLGLVKI